MLIKDIKKVAEHIWKSVTHEVYEGPNHVIVETKLGTFDFDPVGDDADAMMVFKALIDECKNKKIVIGCAKGFLTVTDYDLSSDSIFAGEFNNENICLAYLAVMESK